MATAMFIIIIVLLFLCPVFFCISAPIGIMTLITAYLTRDKKLAIQGLVVTLFAALCGGVLFVIFKWHFLRHLFED